VQEEGSVKVEEELKAELVGRLLRKRKVSICMASSKHNFPY
jgi:hypothetical protein